MQINETKNEDLMQSFLNQINSNNLLDNNETNNRVHLNENQLTRRGNKMHYQSNNHNQFIMIISNLK